MSFGSFANVLIHRIPLKENFISERSRCPVCRNPIAFYDNIPLLSYVILKGKCRHCSASISLRYPIVELLMGGLFYLVVHQAGANLLSYTVMGALFILLVLSFIDLDTMLVPDGLILTGIIISLIPIIFGENELLPFAMAAFAYSLTLYLIAVIAKFIYKKDSMGGGDIKLAFFLGLILGPQMTLLAAFLTFISAAFILLILKWSGFVKFGQEVPFIPFMALGAALAMLYGEEILDFYFTKFM